MRSVHLYKVSISLYLPLFFFGLVGFLLVVVGVLLGAHTAAVYYSTRVFPIGYAVLFLLFTIVGTLTVSTGIMLNSLTRMLAVSTRRS